MHSLCIWYVHVSCVWVWPQADARCLPQLLSTFKPNNFFLAVHCVLKCVRMYEHTVQRPEEDIWWPSPSCSALSPRDRASLVNLELEVFVSQAAPPHLAFCVFASIHSGHHACVAIPSVAEPPSYPPSTLTIPNFFGGRVSCFWSLRITFAK